MAHRVRGGRGRFAPAVGGDSGIFFDTLTPSIPVYAASVREVVLQEARDWGRDAVAHMKATAPWEDRSGDARAGLDFSIDENLENVQVNLYHSVSYGKWLEIRWNGKFAVILPTIEALGPDLMRRIEVLL